MKELLNIFKKDIEPEKFNDLEMVVFGFFSSSCVSRTVFGSVVTLK